MIGSSALVTARAPTTPPSARICVPHIDRAEFFRPQERGDSARPRSSARRRSPSRRRSPQPDTILLRTAPTPRVLVVVADNFPTILNTSFGAPSLLFNSLEHGYEII